MDRKVTITPEQREALLALEGQDFYVADEKGIRHTIKVSAWKNTRMYVNVSWVSNGRRHEDSTFLNIQDATDLELFFDNASVTAMVMEIINTHLPQPVVAGAEEAPAALCFNPPTVEEVAAAYDAVGWDGMEVATRDGQFPAFDFYPSAENLRTIQMKSVWQNVVVAPVFKALPKAERMPWKWNELCSALDDEWAIIVQYANVGLVGWSDHVQAFKQGKALRAI